MVVWVPFATSIEGDKSPGILSWDGSLPGVLDTDWKLARTILSTVGGLDTEVVFALLAALGRNVSDLALRLVVVRVESPPDGDLEDHVSVVGVGLTLLKSVFWVGEESEVDWALSLQPGAGDDWSVEVCSYKVRTVDRGDKHCAHFIVLVDDLTE